MVEAVAEDDATDGRVADVGGWWRDWGRVQDGAATEERGGVSDVGEVRAAESAVEEESAAESAEGTVSDGAKGVDEDVGSGGGSECVEDPTVSDGGEDVDEDVGDDVGDGGGGECVEDGRRECTRFRLVGGGWTVVEMGDVETDADVDAGVEDASEGTAWSDVGPCG